MDLSNQNPFLGSPTPSKKFAFSFGRSHSPSSSFPEDRSASSSSSAPSPRANPSPQPRDRTLKHKNEQQHTIALSAPEVAGKVPMEEVEIIDGIKLDPLPDLPNGGETFIFWDIDNLNIPKNMPTRAFIAALFQMFKPALIQTFGNTFSIGIDRVLELNRCNVDVFSCPSGGDAKELADNRLVTKLNALLLDSLKVHRPHGRIVCISNDKDFTPHLYSARNQGWEVAIICAARVIDDLKSAANHLIIWNEFVSHASSIAQSMPRSTSTNRSRSVSPASVSHRLPRDDSPDSLRPASFVNRRGRDRSSSPGPILRKQPDQDDSHKKPRGTTKIEIDPMEEVIVASSELFEEVPAEDDEQVPVVQLHSHHHPPSVIH